MTTTRISRALLGGLALGGVIWILYARSHGPLDISKPRSSTWKGLVEMEALPLPVPKGAHIQFELNGRRIGQPLTAPPFRLSWPSHLHWDGPARLQAAAYDAKGERIAQGDPVDVSIENGDFALRLLSPDEGDTLRGVAEFAVEISRRDGQPIRLDGVYLAIDGKKLHIHNPAGPEEKSIARVKIETQRFSNGSHELTAAVHSNESPKAPVGILQTTVRFDNGRARQELAPAWSDVWLHPGESLRLQPRFLLTDGSQQPAAGFSYQVEDARVAAVDSQGTVNALAAGATRIRMEAEGFQAHARVIVRDGKGFPHFARDGAILESYDPQRSFLPRSLFHLEPYVAANDPKLVQALRDASVNALECGFYLAPADVGNPSSFEGFRRGWDHYWQRVLHDSADFALVVSGDNIARSPRNVHDSLNLSWSAAAIPYTIQKLRDSKRVVAIEMVDESSGSWGSTPKPTDGRWAKLNPPIPENAFVRLMGLLNQTQGRPPVSWPILWLSGPDAAAAWMGDRTFSDYASNYWDNNDWRAIYPFGMSLQQYRAAMDNVIADRRGLLQMDRPALQLISIAGPFYTKLGPGKIYTPGQDKLQSAGIRPEAIPLQVLYGVTQGQAGFRAYAFDAKRWHEDRAREQFPLQDRQTGSDPFGEGRDRWQAMRNVFQVLARVERHLFAPPASSPYLGTELLTGLRRDAAGSMLLVLHVGELEREFSIPLESLGAAAGTRITRIRVGESYFTEDTLPARDSDRVLFAPGAAMIYLSTPTKYSFSFPPGVLP
jgi:hypothetical protein